MNKLAEDSGLQSENNRLNLYIHKETGGIYRRVGGCIFKGNDEYSVLYRKWDDFDDSAESLYCRTYQDFRKQFEPFDYDRIDIRYTEDQAMKKMLGEETFHKNKLQHIKEERKHFKGSTTSRFKRP